MSYQFFQQKLSQLFTFGVIQLVLWYMPPKIIMSCTFHLGSCNCHNPWRMHGAGILYFPIHLPAKNQLNEGNIYQPPLFLMLATSCYPLFCCAQKNRTKKCLSPDFRRRHFCQTESRMRLFSLDPLQKLVVLFAFYWRRGATQQLGWISPTQRLEVGFHHARWWGLPRAKCFFFDKWRSQNPFCLGGNQEYTILWIFILSWCYIDISTTSFCWWFFKPGRKKSQVLHSLLSWLWS